MISIPSMGKTTAVPANIFNQPLEKDASSTAKLNALKKERNTRKAYLYFGVAALALAVYGFAFLYPQTAAFLSAPARLQALQDEIATIEGVELPALEKSRDLKKSAYNEALTERERNLSRVFPDTSDKLGIIRRLENFATAIHTQSPPFEFNSITFGSPVQGKNYTVLPISTSIHSSTANFDRFLELINLSGHLDSEIPIRLMEISNINIRYRGVDRRTGEDQGVDFSVKLNAYSKAP